MKYLLGLVAHGITPGAATDHTRIQVISRMILLYQLLGEVASGLCDGPMFRVVRGVWGRMSVQGMNNRLRKLLETYSRYEGETLHGIRRIDAGCSACAGRQGANHAVKRNYYSQYCDASFRCRETSAINRELKIRPEA
jgi:hypothetical protein